MTYRRFKLPDLATPPATLATVATVQPVTPTTVANVASVAGGELNFRRRNDSLAIATVAVPKLKSQHDPIQISGAHARDANQWLPTVRKDDVRAKGPHRNYGIGAKWTLASHNDDVRAEGPKASYAPQPWIDGYQRLIVADPVVGFSTLRWQQLLDDGDAFLKRWGSQVLNLGWRAEDIFGVHPAAPAFRVDVVGLVPILAGRSVSTLSEHSATIATRHGKPLIYRRHARPGAVCLWDLSHQEQKNHQKGETS